MGCFSRSSSMSDGSLAQPMQARLSATGKGAAPSLTAGGATAAALAASLSAFSAASASRTSLVAAPRSGCCARSLASSGLKPRSGSATRRPRTASRRASAVQWSHMRRCPKAPSLTLSHGLAKFERGGNTEQSRFVISELCSHKNDEEVWGENDGASTENPVSKFEEGAPPLHRLQQQREPLWRQRIGEAGLAAQQAEADVGGPRREHRLEQEQRRARPAPQRARAVDAARECEQGGPLLEAEAAGREAQGQLQARRVAAEEHHHHGARSAGPREPHAEPHRLCAPRHSGPRPWRDAGARGGGARRHVASSEPCEHATEATRAAPPPPLPPLPLPPLCGVCRLTAALVAPRHPPPPPPPRASPARAPRPKSARVHPCPGRSAPRRWDPPGKRLAGWREA
eukprot:scaffold74140_cov66-Phaeocystis_antarctica.AAC.5